MNFDFWPFLDQIGVDFKQNSELNYLRICEGTSKRDFPPDKCRFSIDVNRSLNFRLFFKIYYQNTLERPLRKTPMQKIKYTHISLLSDHTNRDSQNN